jgi:hypothetical protein
VETGNYLSQQLSLVRDIEIRRRRFMRIFGSRFFDYLCRGRILKYDRGRGGRLGR